MATDQRIIYVEGADCTGKTTLIKAIARDDDKVIHNGRFPTQNEAYHAYIKQLKDFKESNFKRLILDRGVLSEVIYGQVMRDTMPDETVYLAIRDLINSFDNEFIVCVPPFGPTVMKWAQRQDSEYVNQFEQYTAIYEMFSRLARDTEHCLIHNWMNEYVNRKVIEYVNGE